MHEKSHAVPKKNGNSVDISVTFLSALCYLEIAQLLDNQNQEFFGVH